MSLQLKDLETVDARLAKTLKAAQTGGDKTAKLQAEVLKAYKEALEQGRPARSVQFETKDEQRFAHDLFLLTNKFRCSTSATWMMLRQSAATSMWSR